MAHILAVDDEPAILELLEMNLSLAGHTCALAGGAREALLLLSAERFDIALLDVMLPGRDGFSLSQAFIDRGIPVIFLTARTAVQDRVKGLRLGADDYIIKPFEPAELLARVDALLRRTGRTQEDYTTPEGITVSFARRQVWRGEKAIELTVQEFDLLCALIRNRNIALSREQLLQSAWGYDYFGETRTVDVHIQRLRKKLGLSSIETVFKFGYRFNAKDGETI
jgi:two-component system alkaline phosphatase synthesis response regulator PhoP